MTILQAVTLLVVAGNPSNNDAEDNDDDDDPSGDNNCCPYFWLSQGIPPTTILTTRMTELLSLCTMSPCVQRAFSKAELHRDAPIYFLLIVRFIKIMQ